MKEGWADSLRIEEWQAIVECDKQFDGIFYYGVKTTRIFCKPSCPSREPKRTNVFIFNEPSEAIHEGFRPCKRCQPADAHGRSREDEIIEETLSYIESRYHENLCLTSLAELMFINQYHLHRMFKKKMNVTLGEYVTDFRLTKAKQLLLSTELTITEIGLRTGFSSPSHFSYTFRKNTQVSPKAYRNRT
ncbi:hypothetical protein SY83_17120 [Paenibacillus swuensis]|uniref:HTH araC/xylS-type domain-containing protein n=1 Tax=Paenibacillus swuensis TaxID=1178515 RepID=A0A172TL64_9BACL|nr:Ada metal-binding domain-containing protein [Paenibacillus swuensis]ANE47716.1 hypothetical protein SY83_17120 [Paenibacillus swuensis]